MPNTKNLLSIVRLKKYFPLGKTSPFGKIRYLRANESVSLDVKQGETFSIVGESGCGKSTLGKTILGLYRPDGGAVYYYGRTVDELVPRYVFDVLKRAETYRAAYQSDPSSERLFQEAKFLSAVKLLGGLLCASDAHFQEGIACLKNRFLSLAALQKSGENTEKRRLATARVNEAETRLAQIAKTYEKEDRFVALEAKKDVGIDLTLLTKNELRQLRKDLQVIFQDPYSSLNPRMTVGQIIEEGVATHGYFKRGTPQMREYVLEIMKKCGLQEHMLHRYPHQFSGGQRQRICIARALAVKPRFVVCDECVSALDASIQSQILNLLTELKEREGLTYLFISHDLSVVRHVSDRVAVMYLGEVSEQGKTEDIFDDPRHPYTISLLSAAPTLDFSKKQEKIIPQGHMPSPVSPPSGCKYHTRCFMAQECCRQIPAPVVEVKKGHFVACHFAQKTAEEKRAFAKTKATLSPPAL